MRTREQVEYHQRYLRSVWTYLIICHERVFEAAQLLGYTEIQAGYFALWLNYFDGPEAFAIFEAANRTIADHTQYVSCVL